MAEPSPDPIDPAVPADPIAALAAATAQLAGSNKELAEALSKIDRRGRRNSWLGGLALAAVLVVAVVGTSSTFERNDRAEQSRLLLEAIEANQLTIKACTSPGHACYDENQVRSNQRLAPIVAVICNIGRHVGLTPEELGGLCRTG